MREAYIERILQEVEFENLVQTLLGEYMNGHEAFSVLSPLLTRVHQVDWVQLGNMGEPWTAILNCIDCICDKFRRIDGWTDDDIAEAIHQQDSTGGPAVSEVERLLYISVLSSEFRLPLAKALRWLGQTECISRLSHVATRFRIMQLVG